MKTAIMTDTNSGITRKEAQDLGIFLVSMPIIINGQTYYEEKDISPEEFYQQLISGQSISTSQPSPGDLLSAWNHAFQQGYDELVYIPMSSGLSNSCQTASVLASEFEGKVQVADNHRISVPLRESVTEACSLAKQGICASAIRTILEEDARQNSIYITVDTLEYLKKGGRITASAAALCSVLNIRPILSIQGDKLDSYAKARGMKKAKNQMIQAIRKDLETRFSHYPANQIHLAAAGSFLSPQEIQEWTTVISRSFPQYSLRYDPLPFSICCHTGPGAVGIGVTALRSVYN